jgi:hypothetical protein
MRKISKIDAVGLEAVSQAKFILKNAGLTFVKPKFFRVDTENMGIEQDAINAAVLDDQQTNSDSKSLFGLPVFDSILFEQLKYTSSDGKDITVPPLSIQTALIEVSQQRNIVSTQIAGRNGTIKEYIGEGDYLIRINGVIAGQHQNIAPKDTINQLMGFCKATVEFNVTSNFLAYFGIYTIVAGYYSFKQIEGQRNVIGFELNCYSDIPIEIREAQDF